MATAPITSPSTQTRQVLIARRRIHMAWGAMYRQTGRTDILLHGLPDTRSAPLGLYPNGIPELFVTTCISHVRHLYNQCFCLSCAGYCITCGALSTMQVVAPVEIFPKKISIGVQVSPNQRGSSAQDKEPVVEMVEEAVWGPASCRDFVLLDTRPCTSSDWISHHTTSTRLAILRVRKRNVPCLCANHAMECITCGALATGKCGMARPLAPTRFTNDQATQCVSNTWDTDDDSDA